jgi:hypothetical protein
MKYGFHRLLLDVRHKNDEEHLYLLANYLFGTQDFKNTKKETLFKLQHLTFKLIFNISLPLFILQTRL